MDLEQRRERSAAATMGRTVHRLRILLQFVCPRAVAAETGEKRLSAQSCEQHDGARRYEQRERRGCFVEQHGSIPHGRLHGRGGATNALMRRVDVARIAARSFDFVALREANCLAGLTRQRWYRDFS